MARTTDGLSGDLIYGAKAIGDELNLSEDQVYYHVDKGRLPVSRLGSRLVASRARLRTFFTGEDNRATDHHEAQDRRKMALTRSCNQSRRRTSAPRSASPDGALT